MMPDGVRETRIKFNKSLNDERLELNAVVVSQISLLYLNTPVTEKLRLLATLQ
jgi:hypothetical protein